MKETTITLIEPIKGHEGPITALTVREPTYREYFEIGDPQIIAKNPDDTIYAVDNDKALQAYADKCINLDPLLLKQLCLADAMQVRGAILDFFLSARKAIPSPSAPTA